MVAAPSEINVMASWRRRSSPDFRLGTDVGSVGIIKVESGANDAVVK